MPDIELKICPNGKDCSGCALWYTHYDCTNPDDYGEDACTMEWDREGETPYSNHVPGPECPGKCVFVKKSE